MDSLFPILSHLVLFLSLATLAFSLAAYVALVLRRRSPAPRRRGTGPAEEVQLLRRYVGRDGA